jgi:hypothetical protein
MKVSEGGSDSTSTHWEYRLRGERRCWRFSPATRGNAVTETEWLGANDPMPMLAFLRGEATDRKLILFCLAWAAVYRIERANGDPAYDVAMQYAEARDNVADVRRCWLEDPDEPAFSMPERPSMWAAMLVKPGHNAQFVTPPTDQAPRLLRELFGNPFRPVTADPAWLTPTVIALAEGIYQESAFDRLPILADALQDAGCDSEDVLNHCRYEGVHVRGCWVSDLLTGRK